MASFFDSLLNLNTYLRLGSTIRIPESLSAVTCIDREGETDPNSVGMSHAGVESIWRSVEGVYKTGTHPGISLCLRRQGKVVLNRGIGHAFGNGPESADHETKVLMQPATPVCYFSGSKAVTAFLIHLLNEDKLINLHDPISYYFPEFGQHGKKNINIHQVLSHRSGIPGLPSRVPVEYLWDKDEIWRLLCATEIGTHRGDQLAYHAVTGGYILARVLEKVADMDIQQFLDERIRKPMNMKYFRYGADPQYVDSVADNYATGLKPMFPLSRLIRRALGDSISTVAEVSNDPRFKSAIIPAGNITGTAEEMGRFYQMLLNDGVWEGKPICQPMTVRHLTQEYGALQFDRTLMLPMRYSAGLMLGGDPVGIWGMHSSAAYGHVGLANKLCWADPNREISVSLQTTGMPIVANNIPSLVGFMNKIDQYCTKSKIE